jgi:hypothetical protein
MLKDKLEQVIAEQRTNLHLTDNNVIREDLVSLSPTSGFVLVISGIRRCGKSTIVKQMLNKENRFYYLNLEDLRLNDFELSDFIKINEIFKETYGTNGTYFFDEIQTIPKWEKFIRSLADNKNKIVVTGSNASLLSKELGSLLTGRYLSYELFPFSYKEFLDFIKQTPSKKSLELFLEQGGFPEYLRVKDVNVLQELFNSVLMRDVAIRFNIKNTNLLKKIGSFLVSNVGKEFSYNKLKKNFSVSSVQTIIDYINFFEDAYLLFTIPKFSYSPSKQQVSPKKIYSVDNGISRANSISFSKDKGRMLENTVFQELRRKHREIFYFREKFECDFLVKEKDKITKAIQVCFELNSDNKTREIQGLIEAMKKTKLKKGTIVTFDQEDSFVLQGFNISLIPAWKWLLKK